MKQGIKILIALFFILCAFGLGKYACDEDCKAKSADFENSLSQLKVQNKALRDTIVILNDSIALLKVSKK